jgi:hypothetical protein
MASTSPMTIPALFGKEKKSKDQKKNDKQDNKQAKEIGSIETTVAKELPEMTLQLQNIADMAYLSLNKKQREQYDELVAMSTFLKTISMSEDPKDAKKKHKLTELWSKNLKPFLKGIGGLVVSFGKFIKGLSAQGITGLLGFLFGLFILIKLGFFQTIIPAIISILGTLLKGIIEVLPVLIKFLWTILTEVVPVFLKAIGDAISDIIFRSLKDWAKQLQKDSPVFAKIVNFFADLFGPDGFLRKAMPFLIGLLAVLWLFPGILGIIGTLASFLIANPIVAAITGIVLGFILLYKYAEEISDWIDNLWESFKNLSTPIKIMIGVLALLMLPITMIIGAIIGLVKLLKYIKANGITSVFDSVVQGLKDFGSWLYDLIVAPFIAFFVFLYNATVWGLKMIASPFVWMYKQITFFADTIIGIVSTIINIVTMLSNMSFDEIILGIKNFVKVVVSKFFDFVDPIIDSVKIFALKFVDFIMGPIDAIIGFAKWYGKTLLKVITTPFKIFIAYVTLLKDIFFKIVGFITQLAGAIKDLFSGKITGSDFIAKIWDIFKSAITSIGNLINDKVKSMFGVDLKRTFKTFIDWIDDMINAILFKIASLPGMKALGMSTYGAKTSKEYGQIHSAVSAAVEQGADTRIANYLDGKGSTGMSQAEINLAEMFKKQSESNTGEKYRSGGGAKAIENNVTIRNQVVKNFAMNENSGVSKNM